MALDVRALEAAFAPIQGIGKKTSSFNIGGTRITLAVMEPDAEDEVNEFVKDVIPAEGETEEGDEGRVALQFIDRFRIGVLSHAVVGVGDLNFQDVEYVETGDKTEEGTPIKKPRYLVIRDIVRRWSHTIQSAVNRKYAELLRQAEEESLAAIEFKPSDLDAEIERVGRLLERLKQEKETLQEALRGSAMLRRVEAVSATDEQERIERTQNMTSMTSPVPAEDEEPEVATDPAVFGYATAPEEPAAPPPTPPPAAAPRQSIIPTVAAPPVQPQPEAPPAPPPQPAPGVPPVPQLPPQEPADSFVDSGDMDSMHAAIEAETRRQLAMRSGVVMDDGSALTGLKPPHAAAAQAAMDIEQERLPQPAASGQIQKVGDVDGKEVYQLPTEDVILPQSEPERRVAVAQVDQSGAAQSVNPRFRGSGG